MKRIVLTGAAAAALLTGGLAAVAEAAPSAPPLKVPLGGGRPVMRVHRTLHTHLKCVLEVTTVAPPKSAGVEQGTTTGTNYGSSRCGSPIGSGAARLRFAENAAGDFSGTLQQWFATGTVFGRFALKQTLSSAPPTAASFAAARFYGTATITGGRGVLHGATGTGTMSCRTSDSLHYRCIARLNLTQTVTVFQTAP